MSNWLAIAMAICLFADADVPMVYNLRTRRAPVADFPPGQEIPVLPRTVAPQDQSKSGERPRSATLQPESRLELIRYVSGEFAHAVKPLPAGKEGFLVYVGQGVNQVILDRAVATHGAAINTGDNVQITRLEFRNHSIAVDINGGGRGKRRWRDHIQVGVAGMPVPTVQSRTTEQQNGPPGGRPGAGSTIFLEFNKPVPDLTPGELKQLLAPFLDFSKQRSASVQWFDTLPPDIKKAIQDRRPMLGMDREMVIAAIGRPGRKVRERDPDGYEIEDWIYGNPPSKTVFVRFKGDRVTNIKQFPQ